MNKALFTAFVVATGSLALAGQEQRPKNVPFYTWVREDTFAGFMADDMVRFERGMQKTQEYITEDPNNMAAVNWLGAGTVYRAVRAFDAGDAAKGDQLFGEAVAMIDKASANAPDDVGIRATAGGALITVRFEASRAALSHRRRKGPRSTTRCVYKAQEAMIDKFPLHLKGEALAGIAEAEFRRAIGGSQYLLEEDRHGDARHAVRRNRRHVDQVARVGDEKGSARLSVVSRGGPPVGRGRRVSPRGSSQPVHSGTDDSRPSPVPL